MSEYYRSFADDNESAESKWNKLRTKFNNANKNQISKSGGSGDNYHIKVKDPSGNVLSEFDLDMNKPIEELAKTISNNGMKMPKSGEKTSDKESRIKAVKKLLADKGYEDYIETLNELVKDDKNKALLDATFGGELADVDLEVSDEDIPVSNLKPTQNEIDLDKSLKWGLTKPEQLDNYYADPVRLGKMPLVTYNGEYVIDGHHRWSQCFCFNPDAKMEAINFEGDLTPMQMLKATQGSIAAEAGKVPVSKVEGQNMFTVDEKTLRAYVEKNLVDEVVEKFPQYRPKLTSREKVVDFIVNNCMKLIESHTPIKGAPSRSLMPQTDQAPGALKRLDKGTVAMSRKPITFRTFSINDSNKLSKSDINKIHKIISKEVLLDEGYISEKINKYNGKIYYDGFASQEVVSLLNRLFKLMNVPYKAKLHESYRDHLNYRIDITPLDNKGVVVRIGDDGYYSTLYEDSDIVKVLEAAFGDTIKYVDYYSMYDWI